MRQPRVFLMDEPLSNLDALLRLQTRADIVAMQRRLGTTVLYVTHDQVEAMTMGHRIAILKAGQLQQIGPPVGSYERPVNTYVASFLGNPGMCLAEGRVESGALTLEGASLGHVTAPDGPVTVGVRPESPSSPQQASLPRRSSSRSLARTCWCSAVIGGALHRAPGVRRSAARARRVGAPGGRRQARGAAPLRHGHRRAPGSRVVTALTSPGVPLGSDPTLLAARSRRGRTRRVTRLRESLLGFAMIAPVLAVFGVFTFFPFVKNFDDALHKPGPYPGTPSPYVGPSQFFHVIQARHSSSPCAPRGSSLGSPSRSGSFSGSRSPCLPTRSFAAARCSR